ncbi:general amino acid permease AGP3 [Metarhizium album ARSEF 1941]|uniref:General amino acid permease AGP3 n=1 Tax=Metarhizium album (strain ARSEF 1941) TaxID=1081103 RepID=A0A0B2WRD5_METAS|nr:general amino acid permease AGP3 [Metarhizium album ARSEF 1941]KHN98621.1 general amino acid permease AGP3 [Metarhizium album ARSEF 1941]
MFWRPQSTEKSHVEPGAGDSSADNHDDEIANTPFNTYGSHHDVGETSLIDPDSGVKRGLENRHLSMMALAGIIGPGLLVGAGGALNNGGPASLLIGFGVIGIIAFAIMQSLGEVTTLFPGGGSFVSLAERMVDKSFSVAVGWNYFIIWAAVLANEYNVICGILTYWTPHVPLWGFFLILWSLFTAFQLLGVEAFGEAEFWLALFKILGLSAYFIFSIVYAAGGLIGQTDSLGFRYWHDPGAFNGNGFRGVAVVFVFCSTFYAGIESVAVAATETRNPGVAVPQAIRQVFWRIIFVYMGSALFFGITCPADADGLINGGAKALQSPMTIAIQIAGWNGGKLTPLNDSINSSIYIGSRTVLYMAQSGKAPKFLGRTNKRGVPVWAIVLTNAVGSISMMNVSTGASKAYGYIVNLSGVSTFLVWGSISFIHIRFRRAWIAQNRNLNGIPFKSMFYPFLAYFGLVANVFLAVVQGWTTLSPFNASNFVDAYILLPLFGFIYLVGKLYWGSSDQLKRSWDIDLDSGRRTDLDDKGIMPEEEPCVGSSKASTWRRAWNLL